MSAKNPCGLRGIDFVEFASPQPERLDALFKAFGFSKVARHQERDIDLYQQGDMSFLLNRAPGTFAAHFTEAHGPCISSMGWRVDRADDALTQAMARGARAARGDFPVPAIFGIGDSVIYCIDGRGNSRWEKLGFAPLESPEHVPSKGFTAIDHLTNNVAQGTMGTWSSFYRDVFGFEEVRYFDIRGVKTGLQSYALRSPCGTFCIPINEAGDAKSQINEYLEEYKGPGVQHLAFATDDILRSLAGLEGTPIEMLDIEDGYYDQLHQRVPNVTEDVEELRRRNVLVDGDSEGYLLQIFTRNLIGPIFIELIQRKNHLSFGEGNFGALFRSIERDQARRGYLQLD